MVNIIYYSNCSAFLDIHHKKVVKYKEVIQRNDLASVLNSNLAELRIEIQSLESSGAYASYLDVME